MVERLLIEQGPVVKRTKECGSAIKINQHAEVVGKNNLAPHTPTARTSPGSAVLPSSPGGPATYPLLYRAEMYLRNEIHKAMVFWAWLKCKRPKTKQEKGYIKAHRGTETVWQKKVGGE